MEIPIWFIYSILACLSIGFYAFFTQVQAKSKYDDFYFYFFTYFFFIILFPYLIFKKVNFFNLEIILLSFIFVFLLFFILKTRFVSLKYIASSTYFINYRIFSSILLLVSGIIFFSEEITINDYFGIFIGFIVFYLLLEKEDKKGSLEDLKKGILFLFFGIMLLVTLQTLFKYITINSYNISLILFYEGIFGLIILFISKRKNLKKLLRIIPDKKYISILIVSGIMNLISIYFNFLAYIEGNLAVVYKIISYSIFITIFLSMIFYKEKVNLRKTIAFILTIISIWFFL